MPQTRPPLPSAIIGNRLPDAAAGCLLWAGAWAAMLGLDGQIDLANQSMLLVLGAALATLWLPTLPALVLSLGSVAAFNWLLVPPRNTFLVDTPQHLLLLAAMALVSGVVVLLMARLRREVAQARQLQQQAEQLQALGEALRDTDEPHSHAGLLQAALAQLLGSPSALLLSRGDTPTRDDAWVLGTIDADEEVGLWHCLHQGLALGPGTGRHESLAQWFLPLRARQATMGAAVLRLSQAGLGDDQLRSQAQALCDQMGLALQRVQQTRLARRTQAEAQLQAVRNALLTAISHDHRTPLATILGAASSLQDQGDRLDSAQRQRLAQRIVQEADHLSRLTDNTLQLARLDAPGLVLRKDWESAEDIVGTVLRRARQRAPGRPMRARLEPGLPLLNCDALLLTQLLDNLVDNALNHTPPDTPIEVLVRLEAPNPADATPRVVLAVRDRGPGVPPAWRERVFDVFQRGVDAPVEGQTRRGAGVGLAVCRAIARAHGGELRLRARGHGGSSFECLLPCPPTPAPSVAVTSDTGAQEP